MSDSLVLRLLLDEGNTIQNLWKFYLIYAILTGIYYLFMNFMRAFLYAGITLEIIMRLCVYTIEVNTGH